MASGRYNESIMPASVSSLPGIETSFTLNGRLVSVRHRPGLTALGLLRDRLDVISPKNGCEPQASCGCCAVLIDGKPQLACAIKAEKLAGREVVTLEGLSESSRRQIADCFVSAGGVQCGFCIPGFALRGHALLEKNPQATRGEIARELRGHLCRCTGYVKILDALEAMGRARSGKSAGSTPSEPEARSEPEAPARVTCSEPEAQARVPRSEPDAQARVLALPKTDSLAGASGSDRASGSVGNGCGVGARLPRYRGAELVLGDFRYVDDIKVERMWFAAMRFSDHPRATVKAIDPSAALATPGVQRVLTAADVPGERHVGLIVRDWPILVAIGEQTRCVGDILAIVVADDQHVAREAAAKIAVDYDVLTPVSDPEQALAPDAPPIHANGNLLSRSAFRRGAVDAVLAASAHVVEDTYTTQRIEHMFLEPEACIAIPVGARRRGGQTESDAATAPRSDIGNKRGRHEATNRPGAEGTEAPGRGGESADAACAALRVLSQGQGVFDDRRQIASVLGWEVDRVQVELVSNGGAFGGKEDLSIQAQTALAAALCGRPVKCTLTREESFRLHPKRHAVKMRLKVGCDADGRLTAVRARMIGDKGAYASVGAKVLERAAGHAIGPYRCENVDIESLAVYTNNPPCGAMRGFGANQAAFAIERCLDRLAKPVGIDGWEMRWRNVLEQGDRFCTGQRLDKPFGLKKTLLAVRDAYRAAKYAGIACGIKNVGIGNGLPEAGRAVLRVESPDRVTIRTGFTEMGQGYFTICVQVACEETGLPPGVFEPLTDTSAAVDCGQTTASRATVLGALAIQDACRKLSADLAHARRRMTLAGASGSEGRRGANGSEPEARAREQRSEPEAPARDSREALATLVALVGREYVGLHETAPTNKPGAAVDNPRTHLTYGFATQVVLLDDEGAIKKVIAAHDVGRVMNPTLLEGQMEGSIHMGLGYALSEDFPCDAGALVNTTLKSLGVLRAHQMPDVECIFIEEPDPETAYGARGVGEIGLVPTAPAVAAALEAFDGVHRTSLPMKDSPAARALARPPWTRRVETR